MTLLNCLLTYVIAATIATVIILGVLQLHAQMERQDEQ
jgi:hypothetical protein